VSASYHQHLVNVVIDSSLTQTTRRQMLDDINTDIQISKETNNLRKKFAQGNTH
jgi:hypothetical protein